MGRLPSLQFYPGDWLRDPISGCSIAAQGLWLRMMFLMHDSNRYGYLCDATGSPILPAHAASRCGLSLEQYESLLAELDGVSVPSRTAAGVIYSRRMVRDSKRRAQYRKSKENNKIQNFHTDSTQVPLLSSSSSSISNIKTTTKADLPPPHFLGRVLRIEAKQHQRLCEVFGHVNGAYQEADLWLEANPQKKRKNHFAFMRNWLSRSKEKTLPLRSEVTVGSGPEMAPRYCATCGHTGSWHLNETKRGRQPGHEFVEGIVA